MSESVTRRTFAKAGAGLAAASFSSGCGLALAAPQKAATTGRLEVRPYQLMCVVCRLGEGRGDDLGDPRLTEILRVVRKDRKTPVTLRMNADTVYRYQNPGHADDTPEGELFNAKRDLDILQRMGLVPGDARPAIDMFERLLVNVPKAQGLCGYGPAASATWRGCARAASGSYEKGHALGISAILPPRSKTEKADFKKRTSAEVCAARTLRIRPHHLLCMSCFYGRSKKLAPIQEDNLFEAIDTIHKNPDVPVTLVAGCCMICPPCSHYEPSSNLCLGGHSMALRDQKKDLDVLQRLGLKYGDTLPARKLYELVFLRIASTKEICAYGDGKERATEWSICGGAVKDDGYQKARREKLGIPEAQPSKGATT
jgi:hypothetical protein